MSDEAPNPNDAGPLARCAICAPFGGCQHSIPATFRIKKHGPQAVRLGRTTLIELITPTQENKFHPPVESFGPKKPGTKSGSRIVSGTSLCAYLHQHSTHPSEDGKKKARSKKAVAADKAASPAGTPGTPTSKPAPSSVPTDGATPAAPSPASVPGGFTTPPPPPPPMEDTAATSEEKP